MVAVVFVAVGIAFVRSVGVGASTPTGLSAADAGLVLSAVASTEGAGLRVDATVQNTRNSAAEIRFDCGSPVTVYVTIPLPISPAGQLWSGTAGAFKQAALVQGTGPGGVAATAPARIQLSGTCEKGPGTLSLAPQAQSSGSAVWSGEIVDGVVAAGGVATVEVVLGHDPSVLSSP